jgi:hypothetical protein
MRHYLILVLLAVLFSSCTKEIDLNLENKSGEIVIEGDITNLAGPQTVKVTRTAAFTSTNGYPAVTNAFVTIRDNIGTIDTLVYTTSGEYKTTRLVTAPGRTYFLTVRVNNVEYTANSTMPNPVAFNGLTKDSISFGGDITYSVLPNFVDPVEIGNRYLFISKAAGKSEKIYDLYSDNVNNGILNQRSIFLTYNNSNTDIVVERGDSINVEMQCITNDIYIYYQSLLELADGGAGGGTTPANPTTNISNGALGYFSAHAVAFQNIVL